MPHKYVSEEVLNRLEGQISSRKAEIGRIRSISRHDKDGISALIDRLRELLDQSIKGKDTALDGLMEDAASGVVRQDGSRLPPQLYPAEVQDKMALIFRGEEKAFAAVLDMLTNSDRAVDIFVDEVVQLEKQLEQLRKYEQRASAEQAG